MVVTPFNAADPVALSPIMGGLSAKRNAWFAALSHAKNESDRLVCAKWMRPCLEHKAPALMECAASSS
jgi:hypothetical protein